MAKDRFKEVIISTPDNELNRVLEKRLRGTSRFKRSEFSVIEPEDDESKIEEHNEKSVPKSINDLGNSLLICQHGLIPDIDARGTILIPKEKITEPPEDVFNWIMGIITGDYRRYNF